MDLGKGAANSLRERGQLIFSMGTECRKVHTLAVKATTPSKVFLHLKTPHLNSVLYITLNNTKYIFSSAGYKK